MKLFKHLFSYALILISFVILVGCNLFGGDEKIVSIDVDDSAITEDILIDDFNISDIDIVITKGNDKKEIIPLNASMLTKEDLDLLDTEGTHTITFMYMEHELSFTVTLVSELTRDLKEIYKLALSSGSVTSTYEDWLDSIKGEDGLSIKSATIDTNGHLILTLSNNQVIDAGKVTANDAKEVELKVEEGYIKWRYVGSTWNNLIAISSLTGQNGNNGNDGIGISKVEINLDGELIVTYTDSKTTNLGKIIGTSGKDGVDGKSIINANVNEEGYLIITFSDNSTLNAGYVKGLDGSTKEIVFNIIDNTIKWKYEDSDEWSDLISLDLLKGSNGEDGQSAYEIYLKYHPDYTGTEEEWINDLINGSLGEEELFEVRFVLDGGVLPNGYTEVIKVKEGSTIDLPIPIKEHYKFNGWYTGFGVNDGKFTNVTPVSRDITLYATYTIDDNIVSVTYHNIEEIGIKQINSYAILTNNNHLYVTSGDYIINSITLKEEALYHDVTEYLMLDEDEYIEELCLSNMILGMIIKTSKDKYYGYNLSNDYGQLGLGHTDYLGDNKVELFANISLNELEEIDFFIYNYTYNLVITTQNRVFFTGTLLSNDGVTVDYSSYIPVDISEEFNLAEDEYFINNINDPYYALMAFQFNDYIATNKRIFIPSIVIENVFELENQSSVFTDATQYISTTDNIVLLLVSTSEGIGFLTKTGTYASYIYGDDQVININLNENELIVSVDYANMLFITNQNRYLQFNDLEDNLLPTEIDFDITGNILNVLLYSDASGVYSIYQTDTFNYYKVYETGEKEYFAEDITSLFNGINGDLRYTVLANEEMKILLYNNDKYYTLEEDGLTEFNILSYSTYTLYYVKDTVITLDDYSTDYIIKGWEDADGNILPKSFKITENLELRISLGLKYDVYIYNKYQNLYFEVIEGGKLDINEVISSLYIPYGYEFKELRYSSGESFDFNEPITRDIQLNIILQKKAGFNVSIVYVDENNNNVYFENVLVMENDFLSNPEISRQIPSEFKIINYYLDNSLTTVFDINSIISQDIIIYAKVVKNDKRTVSFILPYDLGVVNLELYHGLNIYDVEYRLLLSEYFDEEIYDIDGVYYDSEYYFYYDEYSDDLTSDLTLYVKLEKLVDIHIVLIDESMEYRVETNFVYYNDATLSEIIFDLNRYDYIILNVYFDEDLTLVIDENYTFLENTKIYVLIQTPSKHTLNINFPNQPQFNFSLDVYNGKYLDIYYEVYNHLEGLYIYNLYIYGLYYDMNFTMPYKYDSINSDLTLYVETNDVIFKNVTIVLPDNLDIPDFTFFVSSDYYFDHFTAEYYLNNYINENELKEYYIYGLYFDSSLTNIFNSSLIKEDITLYADYDVIEYTNINFVVVNDEKSFTLNHRLLETIDFILIDDYLYFETSYEYTNFEIYFDQAQTTLVSEDFIINESLTLYIKLIDNRNITLTYQFDIDTIETFTDKIQENSLVPIYKVFDYIESNITNEYNIYIELYLDSEYQIMYNYDQILEDTTFYVKTYITYYVNVGLASVNQDLEFISFEQPESETLSISEIEYYIRLHLNPNLYTKNVKLYYDPLCELEYNGEIINSDIVLFVTFDIVDIKYIEFIFNEQIPEYNSDVLSGDSFKLENIYRYVEMFLGTNSFELEFYYDSNYEIKYNFEPITENTIFYTKVVYKPVYSVEYFIGEPINSYMSFYLTEGRSYNFDEISDFIMNSGYLIESIEFYYDKLYTQPVENNIVSGPVSIFVKVNLIEINVTFIFNSDLIEPFNATISGRNYVTYEEIEKIEIYLENNYPMYFVYIDNIYTDLENATVFYVDVSIDVLNKITYRFSNIADFVDYTYDDSYLDVMKVYEYLYSLNIDFDTVELYLDQDFTLYYEDYYTITSDQVLYVNVVVYPRCTVTYHLIGYGISVVSDNIIDSLLQTNRFFEAMYLEHPEILFQDARFFYDEAKTLPYDYSVITENTDIYVEIFDKELVNVILYFVNAEIDPLILSVTKGEILFMPAVESYIINENGISYSFLIIYKNYSTLEEFNRLLPIEYNTELYIEIYY